MVHFVRYFILSWYDKFSAKHLNRIVNNNIFINKNFYWEQEKKYFYS